MVALHSTRISAPLNGLALCAGYGGLELGIHIAEPGYRTVCFVEREAHAAATLVSRMEDEALDRAPVWSDVKSFDGRPWRGRIHILTAGYPCQPFSSSGKRRGAADPRHLWPDIARIIGETEPEWVFLENVLGHLDLGFFDVGRELQRMGFRVKAGLFSAAEAGASHWRQRLFVLAHADREQQREPRRTAHRAGRPHVRNSEGHEGSAEGAEGGVESVDALLAPAAIDRLPAGDERRDDLPLFAPAPGELAAWHTCLRRDPSLQPALHGVDDGVADRMDELRAAGNGVCSLAAALAYRTLKADFGG
ncbi:MAG: DNA cytosine methyltransferase [Parvibaculaceae bacterium]|nr:DNA cytosine methyltransferase [Parvibaculaceae bacterium]